MEQLIRATQARNHGLTAMLLDDNGRNPEIMAEALRELPHRNPPSYVVVPGLLDGTATVNQLVGRRLDGRQRDSGTTLARQTGG